MLVGRFVAGTRWVTVHPVYGIGDSHTFNSSLGLVTSDFYPHLLAATLGSLGCSVVPLNNGVSGDTSAQMLARVPLVGNVSVPGIAIIYGGANDGVGGSTDTTANLVSIGQALQAKGYSRLIVGLMHYLNYSSGGDTLDTPLSANVTLRGRQQDAADALGAVVADFYTYMRSRIVAGTDTQGAFAWHVADSNPHLNAYGEQILADCILSVMPADWIADLM